ncbi:hypothetical protein [Streptomyces brasiliensis]|uniref:Uncharacterized protein n=1 Tax=Streptomyces brasiliensis TaxID=1954 RepID=A0A917L421_9ACTN|nr:hypothetical protein [Streptomyces brasiliensis]GGJ42034.1 hypothetical protein GCM10010121_061410 [Streptomyces brasiliensis]
MQVSIAACAVGRGTPDTAALLYCSSNSTNLVGGWAYGAWRHGGSSRRHQAPAAACLTLASLPLTFLDAPLAVGVTLPLTGPAVPVLLVLASVLTESSVPRAVLTQAFTWRNSASAAGSAAAAAVAGRVVDAGGGRGRCARRFRCGGGARDGDDGPGTRRSAGLITGRTEIVRARGNHGAEPAGYTAGFVHEPQCTLNSMTRNGRPATVVREARARRTVLLTLGLAGLLNLAGARLF